LCPKPRSRFPNAESDYELELPVVPDRRFDPKRAVEITAPAYGSGYRIGGRLVLTAAHLLPPKVGGSCNVRFRRDAGGRTWSGTVAWLAPGWTGSSSPSDRDAGLVRLAEEADSCEPALLGRLPEDTDGLKLGFDFFGWPNWAQTKRKDRKPLAGGRHVDGLIYLADTSPEGLLVLEPRRQPEAEPGQPGSPWEGFSGAAVVCDGLVVGVQRHHQNPRRPGSLEAVLLTPFATDAGLQQTLASIGIADPWPTVSPGLPTWIRWALGGAAPDSERALAELLFLRYSEDRLEALLRQMLPDPTLSERRGRDSTPLSMARLAAMLLQETEVLEGVLESLLIDRPDSSEQVDLVRRYIARSRPAGRAERPASVVRVRARIPKLPNHYIERVELLDVARRVAERRPSLVAITGGVGTGKTTFACGLARSEAIGSAFEGRICWLRPALEGTDALTLQRGLYSQLGCEGEFTAQHWTSGLDQLANCVATAYDDQPILAVVDDPREPITEIIEALDCADSLTVLVLSTNAAALRTAAGPKWTVELAGLGTQRGESLLAAWASVDPRELPQPARRLAAMVGYSPLALAMLGAMARERGGSEATWEQLELDVSSGDVAGVGFPGQPQARFSILLDRELASLSDQSRRALEAFAIFPPGVTLEVGVLSRTWGLDAGQAYALATDLVGRSLLDRDEREVRVSAFVRGRIREAVADIAELAHSVLGKISTSPPIFHAIEWRDEPLLAALARRPADLRERVGTGMTPLHLASLRGWLAGVQQLLRAGSSVADTDENGSTALHNAAQSGDVDVTEALLAAGADATCTNDGDKTPLDVAAAWGHTGVVRSLLGAEGHVWTVAALQLASSKGHTDIVRLLLSSERLSVDRVPEGGGEALIRAAQNGHERAVSLLVESGVNADFSEDDWRPLFLSAQNDHLGVVQALLRHGASVDAENQRGGTALIVAAQNGNEDVVGVLLGAGASPHRSDHDGSTALHLACLSKNAVVVDLLLNAGADVDALDSQGLTPLHYAVSQLQLDNVVSLLEHGARVDHRGERAPTALMLACSEKSLSGRQQGTVETTAQGTRSAMATVLTVGPPPDDLIQHLIEAGADVAAHDANGDTALHYAAQAMNPSAVDLLLAAGGDPAAVNKQGLAPLDVAHQQQSREPDDWRLALRNGTLEKLLQGS
jgi:ankyrin repeat protein